MVIQEMGETTATVAAGIEQVLEMIGLSRDVRREPIPVSELVVGLQCGGGADSFSGLSANPALGVAVDMLVSQGGTAILAETPEIYGAENLLLQRVASEEVGHKLIDLLTWWDQYTSKEPHGFDHNASPGNRAGGLTTILEKSIGAIAKGGSSSVNEVYQYAERVTEKGLVFMDSPGFDPVSATGQVAGGANLIVFTRGRGSCFGCRPAPSLKLATNTPMFNRMPEDMDVNCGVILDGVANIGGGQAGLPAHHRHGVGAEDGERDPGLRGRRVRPMAHQRLDLTSVASGRWYRHRKGRTLGAESLPDWE